MSRSSVHHEEVGTLRSTPANGNHEDPQSSRDRPTSRAMTSRIAHPPPSLSTASTSASIERTIVLIEERERQYADRTRRLEQVEAQLQQQRGQQNGNDLSSRDPPELMFEVSAQLVDEAAEAENDRVQRLEELERELMQEREQMRIMVADLQNLQQQLLLEKEQLLLEKEQLALERRAEAARRERPQVGGPHQLQQQGRRDQLALDIQVDFSGQRQTRIQQQAQEHQMGQQEQQNRRSLDNTEEEVNHEQIQAEHHHKKVRRVGLFLLLGLVILSVAVVIPVRTNKNGTSNYKCFTSTQELRDTTDRFVELQLKANENLLQEEIIQVYGTIEDWCVGEIQDFSELFSSRRNPSMLRFSDDISRWNVSAAVDMSYMFSTRSRTAGSFNQNISNWDVSRVNDMSGMFAGARSFNGDISHWIVSNVKHMKYMFWGAHSFNQDISSWDTSQVQDMNAMFFSAVSFNQDISGWDVSGVHSAASMFYFATSFNLSLCRWGDFLRKTVDVTDMFAFTSSCPSKAGIYGISSAPTNLLRNPPGPFCYACVK